MRDPYTVLGVPKTASDEDVKRAFRRLAKRLHPDLNPGNRAVEQQFRELNAANEILSDPEKRRRFDRGEIDAEGKDRGFTRSARSDSASIDDLFEEFFGRSRREARGRAKPHPTAPPQTLRIEFLEAALGATR